MSDSCIFCRIGRGEIPAAVVYQDEHVLAFLDINPLSTGHTLVILKKHVERLDQCSPEDLCVLTGQLPKIASAVIKTVQAPGFNILVNNGRAAGQLVDHLHIHIIPRHSGDGALSHHPAGKYTNNSMQELAEKISQTIQ